MVASLAKIRLMRVDEARMLCADAFLQSRSMISSFPVSRVKISPLCVV